MIGFMNTSRNGRMRFFGVIDALRKIFLSALMTHRVQRDVTNLSQMSDHMLADIGLNRSEIEFVVRNGGLKHGFSLRTDRD